jgi:hypothetical protein
LEAFIRAEDEDLLVLFELLTERGHDNLDWSSAQFEIRDRHPEDAQAETLNFTDLILFPDSDPPAEVEEAEEALPSVLFRKRKLRWASTDEDDEPVAKKSRRGKSQVRQRTDI